MNTSKPFFWAFIVGICLLNTSVNAQSTHFAPGTLNLSVGSSVLHNGAINMPLNLGVEYGAMEYLGVGAYLGYGVGIKKDYWPVFNGSEWVLRNLNVHHVMVGGQATFHFWNLLEVPSQSNFIQKTDVFATGYVGARFIRRGVFLDQSGFEFPKNNKFFLGASLTGRYYVSPQLAVYLEAGRFPSGYLGFGVTYQLSE